MFGLNEKEVLTSDQKISTDDYSLSLVDMAYDGNIGRILIKLEELKKEAEKELKQLPGQVASKAANMCYYTDLSNEKEAYYWLDINGEQENIRITVSYTRLSVITVMVSSLLIDFVQNFNLDETSVPASE